MTITILLFIVFTLWAIAYVGVPASYSALYYHAKTKYTYTLAMPMLALAIIFTQTDPFLQAAGAALILGTAAPNYEHRTSLSLYLHYGFTAASAALAWWSIGGLWMAIAAVLMLRIAKLLASQPAAKNAIFWMEVIFFTVVFWHLIFNT